jgi:hypothetical protein
MAEVKSVQTMTRVRMVRYKVYKNARMLSRALMLLLLHSYRSMGTRACKPFVQVKVSACT